MAVCSEPDSVIWTTNLRYSIGYVVVLYHIPYTGGTYGDGWEQVLKMQLIVTTILMVPVTYIIAYVFLPSRWVFQ